VDFGHGFGNDGRQPTLGNDNNEACAGVGGLSEILALFGPMTAMPSGAIYFLESVHRSALSLAWCFLPGCKTLTFWLGDGGACGIIPLVGGVALEARDMLAMAVADKVGPS
jgi:hypothetical protein